MIGRYPTPVELMGTLSRPGCQLWVKRDDLTGSIYGGNKVRKLERLLADAKAKGAKRVLTIGAVGSHHVLATAVYGTRAGFEVEAVLAPQPRSQHAVDDLRADLGLGVRAFAAGSYPEVALRVAGRLGSGTYLIPVGGSNVLGALGYVDAVRELKAQIDAGAMPEPDLIVATLGSGGTVGGIAAGLALTGMKARVLAVTVTEPPAWNAFVARRIAARCFKHEAGKSGKEAARLIDEDRAWLGQGYGHATPEGEHAMQIARAAGLALDPTYTAKAFAAALHVVEKGAHRTILYWHTLSSAPMEPLLLNAPREEDIDPALLRLFR